nr:glycosyl hydrolase [Kineococcus aurantiacus]
MRQLDAGAELGAWCGSLDVAVGAFSTGGWAQAAAGGHDEVWRRSLTVLRDKWSALQERCRRDGDASANRLFVRFAHEANGDWYDWSFGDTDPEVVKAAWARYRRLQREVLPAAQLVMSVNRESVGSSRPWTDYFPGSDVVDVLGVDYYNQFPYVATQARWDASVDDTSGGEPVGLGAHLDFARSVGLPLSVGEWSGNAENGDSPVFVENMHRFFVEHGGSGAGQVLYEVQFNVDRDGGRWSLTPGSTRMPRSAQAYAALF